MIMTVIIIIIIIIIINYSLSNKVESLVLPLGGEVVLADVLVTETFGDDPLAGDV